MHSYPVVVDREDFGDHGSDVEAYLDSAHENVSRTFDLALMQMRDQDLRKQIRDGYLLCRIADTIEDTRFIDGERKAELLESYSDLVEDSVSGEAGYTEVEEWVSDVSESLKDYSIEDLDEGMEEADHDHWDLVRNAHAAFSSYQEFDERPMEDVGDSIQEMAEGMADYVSEGKEGIRIEDEDDLFDYCHIVAGTVGELLTDLFVRKADDVNKEVLRNNSEDYAQLLQRINVARDPVADLEEENAIFIPETYMQGIRHEKFEERVDEAVNSEEVGENYETLVDSVETVLESADMRADSAVEYISQFDTDDSNGIRAYLETPMLLALATVHQTEPEDAFTEEGLKIGRDEVGSIMAAAGSIEDEEWEDRDQLLEDVLNPELEEDGDKAQKA